MQRRPLPPHSPHPLGLDPHRISSSPARWLRESSEAAGVLLAVVAFGLGSALWMEPTSLSGTAYPAPAMTPSGLPGSTPDAPSSSAPAEEPAPVDEWLVDGFNVLHAVLLGGEERVGWWTAASRERVLAAVAEATRTGARGAPVTPGATPDASVWVVFDGTRSASGDTSVRSDAVDDEAPEVGRVRTVFAPSADDWLVRRVKQARDPARVAIVTADRKLANRARHHGARVVAPREFLSGERGDPESRKV